MVKQRLNYLGIVDVYMEAGTKLDCLADYMEKKSISLDEILYMGDDIPDRDVMKKVGLPACPKDATVEILAVAEYVSTIDGGKGCVRDVIEQTLRLHGKWFDA